ncbi:putative Metal-dependent phosphohydrolase [groundwater metagenome]|uniref:5'-deoxynucleotidase n=1 Tax=groundwater metagenome TaxID=717931 RepID=A0A098E8U8_9ZZZZ
MIDIVDELQMKHTFLSFLRNYKILRDIPRSGWIFCGIKLNEVENVAEHTLDTAIISMLLTDLFRKNGFEIDGEKILRSALIHDVEESVLTDIPYPCKKYLPDLSKAKEEIAKEIFSRANLKDIEMKYKYLELWKEKKKGTVEGDIIEISDLLSMIYEHAELRRRHIKTEELAQHLRNCLDDLKPLIKKYEFLKEVIPKF